MQVDPHYKISEAWTEKRRWDISYIISRFMAGKVRVALRMTATEKSRESSSQTDPHSFVRLANDEFTNRDYGTSLSP